MAAKEAKARIKINKFLEESGWRFFDAAHGKANVVLEPNVKLTKARIDALGENPPTPTARFSTTPKPPWTPRSPKSCAW